MVKIYTKKGDKGMTFLACGKRVKKDCPRLCAYGDVDELNSVLGLCRAENDSKILDGILHRLQGELFVVGADLATTDEVKAGAKSGVKAGAKKVPRVNGKMTKQLEKDIDAFEKKLTPLKNFILPAGSDGACFLHLARTVCRRAERSVAALIQESAPLMVGGKNRPAAYVKINPEILVYLNRLGDLLFVMARLANKSEKISEEKWAG